MKELSAFICYASEDRETVAFPLANRLREAGLEVQLDRLPSRLDDSLSKRISDGLANNRFGIVIVSSSFLAKQWPGTELDTLLGLESAEQNRILPIVHQLGDLQVLKMTYPMLMDRIFGSTNLGVEALAKEIINEIVAAGLHPRGESPSTMARSSRRIFIKLLDGTPSKEAIVQFLKLHLEILTAGLGIRLPPLVDDQVSLDELFERAFQPHTFASIARWSPPFIHQMSPSVHQTNNGIFDFFIGEVLGSSRSIFWKLIVFNTPAIPIFTPQKSLNPLIQQQIEQIKLFYSHPGATETALSTSSQASEELQKFTFLSAGAFETTIVSGRRSDFSDQDSQMLQELNSSLHGLPGNREIYFGNAYLFGEVNSIKIRTYDWLIEPPALQ